MITMKTIEERAYKAVPDILRINDNYVAAYVSGYRQGAADQHKIDIDKAIKEFRHFITYLQEAEYIERDEDNEVLWKEVFREAMEK